MTGWLLGSTFALIIDSQSVLFWLADTSLYLSWFVNPSLYYALIGWLSACIAALIVMPSLYIALIGWHLASTLFRAGWPQPVLLPNWWPLSFRALNSWLLACTLPWLVALSLYFAVTVCFPDCTLPWLADSELVHCWICWLTEYLNLICWLLDSTLFSLAESMLYFALIDLP